MTWGAFFQVYITSVTCLSSIHFWRGIVNLSSPFSWAFVNLYSIRPQLSFGRRENGRCREGYVTRKLSTTVFGTHIGGACHGSSVGGGVCFGFALHAWSHYPNGVLRGAWRGRERDRRDREREREWILVPWLSVSVTIPSYLMRPTETFPAH